MAINTTSIYEQQKFILQRLSVRPHSTNELRELGIYFPPARIKELRDKGFHIDTFYRKESDSTGLPHRVGVYVLHENEVSQNYQYHD